MTGARQVICFVVSLTFVSPDVFCKIDRVVFSMKYYSENEFLRLGTQNLLGITGTVRPRRKRPRGTRPRGRCTSQMHGFEKGPKIFQLHGFPNVGHSFTLQLHGY